MSRYQVGYSVARELRAAARKHGAGDAELAAIERLAEFRGESVDVERLASLARLAGLPWDEMFGGAA